MATPCTSATLEDGMQLAGISGGLSFEVSGRLRPVFGVCHGNDADSFSF